MLAGVEVVGDWFSVDIERTELFSVASYWTENEKAFESGLYPPGMVEGFHLVSLLDHLSNAILRTDPASCTGWNYGLDGVRFITTVRAEDKIRLRLKVSEVRPKGPAYVLTFDCTVERSNSERPAFVATWHAQGQGPYLKSERKSVAVTVDIRAMGG
ncbi:hypothetical protein ACIBHX_45380 [Nonomuraea sp. NPDC050536]|uniref:hypothetical protein n=1 Tax=Nonomuraea sp. NPDC050536 TaxID=3364366 RepID=UPI0037C73CBC